MTQSLFWLEAKVYKNNQLIKTFRCPKQALGNIADVLVFRNNLNYKIELIKRNGEVVVYNYENCGLTSS